MRTSLALGAESDLALSRPVTLYSPSVGGTPQSAVDGNDSTFVQFGNDGDVDGSAFVNVGVGVNVSAVRILFDGRSPAGCPALGPAIESGMTPDAFRTFWTSPSSVVFDTGLVSVPPAAATDRLWRVRYTLPAGSMGFPGCRLFLASFEVHGHYTPPVPPASGEPDLALNRPVGLSSGAVGRTLAQDAVDGSDATFVQFGDDGNVDGWAYVKVGVGVAVSAVRILFDGRVPADCPALGPVIESGPTLDALILRWTAPQSIVVDTGLVPVPAGAAADGFWRVRYTLPAGSMGFAGCRLFLASFEVRGRYTPPVPPSGAGSDLALNRPITLSSPAVGGTAAQSAVDGNDATFVQFGEDGLVEATASVDLGAEPVSVRAVRVLFDGRVPADCPGLGPTIDSGPSPTGFTARVTPPGPVVVDTGLVTVPTAAAGDRLWRVRYTLRAGSMGFGGCRLFLASFSVFSVGNAPPTADAGNPYGVPEGGSTTLSGSGSDPDGDPLTYSWDLDGKGTFVTPGQKVTYSAAGRDGPASYPVSLRVCDNKGACATSNATVDVTNMPPSISSVTKNGPVDEGTPAMINVAASDPAGALDPLTYSFDCNGDGTYEVGPHSSNSASCTFADNGRYPVGVRVADGDGGLATGSMLAGVLNVAPVVRAGANVTFTEEDLEGDDDDDEGLLFTRAGSFSDPGADTWTATVDWGDGCGPHPLTLTGKTFVLSRRFSDDDDNPCRNGDDDKDKHDKDKHDKDKHDNDEHKDKHKHRDKHDKDKDKDVRVFTINVAVRDDDGGLGTATFTVTLIDD